MDDISTLELADGTAFAHGVAGPGARDIQPARRARRLRAAAVLLLDAALFLGLTAALVLATLLTPWHWSWKRPWKTKQPADSAPDWM